MHAASLPERQARPGKGISPRTGQPAAGGGSVSRIRIARNSRGVPRSTASRGSGTVRKRSTASSRYGRSRGSSRRPGDRPPVSPEHHGVELARVRAEHRRRRVGRRAERLAGLLLPAPGEALLRRAARGAAPVHQPRADLGRRQVRARGR